ncbi:helix-turn-helix transcriptional regulator [uncultured Brevundimonas sp.]|uniref:helix-turn-helix domain-containing protein n=1 Tax=uncultured Brevundimonas sp. TaxID=213418 RepID=UPI002621C30E|nr:helix-turn-helix transcriptional regulator [uncultured Brevundimonas sp.]
MTIDRAPILRAMRAWLALDQTQVADAAGVSPRTLKLAESGERVTDKTWGRLTAYYAAQGLEWWDDPAGIRVRQ